MDRASGTRGEEAESGETRRTYVEAQVANQQRGAAGEGPEVLVPPQEEAGGICEKEQHARVHPLIPQRARAPQHRKHLQRRAAPAWQDIDACPMSREGLILLAVQAR